MRRVLRFFRLKPPAGLCRPDAAIFKGARVCDRMRHQIMFCASLKLSTSTGSALLARRSLPCSKCHPYRHISTTRRYASSRSNPDLNSGFNGSYDPTANTGRGPMFSKTSFGVPRFYPRDLKDRVDDYVVGQERAKKAICATIFNHYQNVRRRRQHEHDERNRKEKVMRQRLSRDREFHQRRRETHPVEGSVLPSVMLLPANT